jgi:hypothetical protein
MKERPGKKRGGWPQWLMADGIGWNGTLAISLQP